MCALSVLLCAPAYATQDEIILDDEPEFAPESTLPPLIASEPAPAEASPAITTAADAKTTTEAAPTSDKPAPVDDVKAEDDGNTRTSAMQDKIPSEKNLTKLHAQMLAEPDNLDHAFAYAQMAAALQKWAEAAATYELMLNRTPALSRVKLELALANTQLKKWDAAEKGFNEVLAENPPAEVKQNIEGVLKQIHQATKTHNITANLSGGFNYDSNANASPAGGQVVIFDTQIPLGNGNGKQNDVQVFGSAALAHSYAPRSETAQEMGFKWNSGLNLYQTEQNELNNLNLKLVGVNTGPEITLPATKMKLAMLGGYNRILLDGHNYLQLHSGDFNVEQPIGERALLSAGIRGEARQFFNSPTISTFKDRTGGASQGRMGIRYAFSPTDIVDLTGIARRERTKREYLSNRQMSATLSYTKVLPLNYFASAVAAYKNTVYDGSDPLISVQARHEKEKSAGLTFGKAFTNNMTLSFNYLYRDVEANIINYAYVNHHYGTALSWRY